MTKQKEVKVDGRLKRSEASRKLIVQAMVFLIEKGVYVPTAQQVADKSGVSIRTVFRQFSEMELLYREIEEAARSTYLAHFTLNFKGDLSTRIKRLANSIVTNHSSSYHLAKAVTVLKWRSASLEKTYNKNQHLLRKYVLTMIPELEASERANIDLAWAMASFYCFERFHVDQEMSLTACKELIVRQLSLILELEPPNS